MNASELKRHFWFGAHYYRPPTPTAAEWEDDMKRLKDYGLGKIQFRVYWRWHERRQDEYQWQDLDELMELSRKHGIKVILQLILENAPHYVFDQLDGYRVDIRGRRMWPISNAAFYPGGWIPCFDHPDVMARALTFTGVLVDRYKNHEALELWHAWNEARCRPMGECACERSIASYRRWLRERFGTVERLNEQFCKCWPDFDAVDAARDTSDYTEMFLWKQWGASRVTDRVAAVTETIRAHDAGHGVMAHVGFNSIQQDVLEDISDDCATAGVVDLYGSSFELRYTPEPVVESLGFMVCDWMRHVCGGRYSIHEVYPSRGRFEPELPPSRIQQWLWTPVAAGACSVFLWQFKKERIGFETNDAGLVEADGRDNPTSLDARATFKLFHDLAADIETWSVPKADVAVVYDLQSDLTGRLDLTTHRDADYLGGYRLKWTLPCGTLYKTALQGAYHLFWLRNIRVDVISSESLDRAARDYKMLYLPAFYVVDQRKAQLLLDYMHAGGRVIADAGFGLRDGNTFMHVTRPGCDLHAVLGYRERCATVHKELREAFTLGRTATPDACVCRVVFETDAAEALGRWVGDDSVAAVAREVGDGGFLALGFSPGVSYLLTEDHRWGMLLERLITEWAGLESVSWSPEANLGNVTCRRLVDSEGREIIMAFRRDLHEDQWCKLSIQGAEPLFSLSHVKAWRRPRA